MSLDRFEHVSEEIFYTQSDITVVSPNDIAALKDVARVNARNRVRICAHPDTDDALHEMIIVMMHGIYVPPHRHVDKSESFHIIEGQMKVVIFEDDGQVQKIIDLGDVASGRAVFYRLASPKYHLVIPETEFVVFHEVTNGPFKKVDFHSVPWAPDEEGSKADQQKFMQSFQI
ncbi:MAG: WbuC family cupin fold metalloprotein [Mariprofundaceae bacterium]|nr:WbuC family cupin fold metalloprotein [Mariprofundaceae bacterium]